MPLEIVRNDITKMQVDAIVNTANPRPIVGGGVDRAIHKVAGTELLDARKKIGDIATGKAAITSAFNLHARFVIHTVGPVWQEGEHRERELLSSCYANSLQMAAENDCGSIAFPLISAGVFGCPSEVAIAVATQAIREFLTDHDMDVYLVVFDHKAFKISSSLFDDVQSFIDERYIEELLDEEYRGDYRDRCRDFETAGQPPVEDAYIDIPMWMSKPKERSLEDLLQDVDDSFSEALLRLIDVKGKTDPEVYKKAIQTRRFIRRPMSTANSSQKFVITPLTSLASPRLWPLRWHWN